MAEQRDVNMLTKALAVVCRLCLPCLIARCWPGGAFAKAVKRVRKHCPFCRAYDEMRNIRVKADTAPERPVVIRFL